ncbi:MAG TPA: penicillin acylase family protein [Ktedonobacteraceae bacterium]|nr:penicillin acylase family protein [Ktedonobacteraceae bacterium]
MDLGAGKFIIGDRIKKSVGIAGAWKRVFRPTTRRLIAEGLHAEIEIIRDCDAVPHIYAQNKQDVFFGLGYVHAQDRLWQMDTMRRLAQGRSSEMFGKATLRIDRYIRTLGFHRAAVSAWEKTEPEIRVFVHSYAAGINAFIQRGKGLSLEYLLTRTKPEPWSDTDILLSLKILALELSGNAEIELLYHEITGQIGRERAQRLFPRYTREDILIVTQQSAQRAEAEELKTERKCTASAESVPVSDSLYQLQQTQREARERLGSDIPYPGDLGSNSWVVDGSKSASAKPLLASDPHLGISIPCLWYLAHLEAGEFSVIGATIPGLPSVVIGRNVHIAWGMSNMNSDVQDLYYEKIDPSGCKAEYRGQWEDLQLYTEIIRVRKGQDVIHTVRCTRHGPILTDVTKDKKDDRELPMALSWTALCAEDTTLKAFFLLNEAHNWEEFTASLSYHVAPPLNFIYADKDNIGYHAAGLMPLKTEHSDPLPLEGWSGACEWQGWVPFADLPHTLNPPEHFIISANQKPASSAYPHFLGSEWSSIYRAQRIRELLTAQTSFRVEDFTRMQADTISKFAHSLLPHLLPLIQPQNEREQQALQLLQNWNYDMCGKSAPAALCGVWMRQLLHTTAEELLGLELAARYEWRFQYTSRVLSHLFIDEDDGLLTHEERTRIARQTFSQAMQMLIEKSGSDMKKWRWDRIHHLQLQHAAFKQVPLLKNVFSVTVPSAGDWGTINYGPIHEDLQQYAGAAYRQIIDLSGTENDLFIQASGQSGNPFSAHYADYTRDWQHTRYRPLRFTRQKVEQGRQTTLYLRPSRKTT